MATLSKNAELKFTLNNNVIEYPLEARDIQVLATFDNESTQANITTSELTFVNEEAQQIRDYISNGLTGGLGIFEGIPFEISAYNINTSQQVFKGYLDLSDGFLDSGTRVNCNLKKSNGLNSLDERISALSLGYLESKGVINSSDYQNTKYVVYQENDLFGLLMSNIVLFLLIKETYDSIKDTSAIIADTASKISMGAFGSLGATIYAIAMAIIQAAYTVILIVAVINLIKQMINSLMPPLIDTKVLKPGSVLDKIATYLGYTFESNIYELDNWTYLPSNNSVDEGLTIPIPQSGDYGYQVSDFFALMIQLYNGKFAIIDNTLHFRTQSDQFWYKQSTFQMPSILDIPKRYNTDELNANRIVRFQTDVNDTWTLENFEGTNHEVITDAINTQNKEAKYLKGLDWINIPLALGNRKNELTGLESFLSTVASYADSLVNLFGANSHLQNLVTGKIGYLKVSQNNYSVPKLLYLNGEKLPVNHRTLLNAEKVYNFHESKSFVSNNFYGQKEIYKEVKIPFGFNDFVLLIDNSYFYYEGQEAKVTQLKWNILQDFAIVDFWVRKPYTKNLKEVSL